MAHHGASRSRIAALALAVALMAGAALTFAASPAQAAGPTLTLSSTKVKDGQTVTVTGKGYVSKPTRLYIAICKDPPTATSCDVDLSRVVQVDYDGGGSFKTKYTINTKFNLYGPPSEDVDCAKVQCVVGSTNAGDPKDRTYNATAKFSVISSGDSAKNSKGSDSSGDDSDPASTADTGGTKGGEDDGPSLPATGSSPITPFLAATGLAMTVVGGVLVVNTRRRPRTHA